MFLMWLEGFKDINCDDKTMYNLIEGIAKSEICQSQFTDWLIDHIVFG